MKPREYPDAQEAAHVVELGFSPSAILLLVKTARIWLLLLLAVLLPLRGAMAAAMLCPMGSPVVHVEAQAHSDSGHHDHDGHEEAGLQGHVHGSGAEDGKTNDTCNTCVSFCSITPMLSAIPTVPHLQDPAVVYFSSIADSPPSFVPEGQERPPRSI